MLQSRDSFEQCGPVLDGAVDLIVRTALVRGGLAERQRNALVHAVGVERLVRIVDHLASYEAVAIVEALPAYAQRGVNRNGALARQRLAAIVQAAGRPQTDRTPTDREATVAKDGAAAREQTASAPAVQAAVSAGASSPVARAATPPPAGERVFYSMRFKRAISPPDKT